MPRMSCLLYGHFGAVAQPAELGQEDARVRFIELELLGVGIVKARPVSLPLEAGEVGALGKEVLVSASAWLKTNRQAPAKRRMQRCCWPSGISSNLKACWRCMD